MKEIIKTLIRFSCNVIKLSEIFCKTPRTESSQILVRGVLFFFFFTRFSRRLAHSRPDIL